MAGTSNKASIGCTRVPKQKNGEELTAMRKCVLRM